MDYEVENVEGVMELLFNVLDKFYNVILMYECEGFNVCLVYNWCSEWYGSFNEVGDQFGSLVIYEVISLLDFLVNYDVNENLIISFDGINLVDDVVNDYFGGDFVVDVCLYFCDIYICDCIFLLGVCYRM